MLSDIPWSPSMSGLDFDITGPSENSAFPKRLGKDLIIIDVDNRPWIADDPADMSQRTWGRLNHYLYGS